MGPEMDIALKGLAAAIAEKEGSEYSEVVSVLRARFSFNCGCEVRFGMFAWVPNFV